MKKKLLRAHLIKFCYIFICFTQLFAMQQLEFPDNFIKEIEFIIDNIESFDINHLLLTIQNFSQKEQRYIHQKLIKKYKQKFFYISPNIINLDSVINSGFISSTDLIESAINTKSHEKTVTHLHESVTFSSNGKYALTGGGGALRPSPLSNSNLSLWNLESLQCKTINDINLKQNSKILTVEFSPDNRYALTAADNNSVVLWDLNNSKSTLLETGNNPIISAIFSPDGLYALLSNSNIYDLQHVTPRLIRSLGAPGNYVKTIAISQNNKLVAVGYNNGIIEIYSWPDFILIKKLTHSHIIYTAAFSPDSKYLITGSNNRNAKLWDLITFSAQELKGHKGSVLAVAFSSNSKFAITGSFDKTAILWNLKTLKFLIISGVTPKEQKAPIYSVALSPDDKYALTATGKSPAILFDISGCALEKLTLAEFIILIKIDQYKYSQEILTNPEIKMSLDLISKPKLQEIIKCYLAKRIIEKELLNVPLDLIGIIANYLN